MAFNYFSSGTGSQNFPKANVGPPKYNKSYSAGARKATTQRQNVGHYGTKSGGGKQSYSNYTPPRAPASPYPGGGGGGGGRTGGYSGGVGSNSSGRISSKAPPPAPKPPPPPNEAQYLLTDTAYKSQNDMLTKAAKDYLSQKNAAENTYNTQYTTNLGELGKQEGLDSSNMEADYGARGMGFGSGAAAKALADLKAQYDAREAQLLADKNTYTGNLGSAYTNFQSEQGINQARYKQEALARRAAKYGLG